MFWSPPTPEKLSEVYVCLRVRRGEGGTFYGGGRLLPDVTVVCAYMCGCVRLIHDVGSRASILLEIKDLFFFSFLSQSRHTPRRCHVQDGTVPLHTTGGR